MVGPNDSFLFEVSANSQVSGRVGFWPTKVEVENPPSTQGAGSYLCVVRSRKNLAGDRFMSSHLKSDGNPCNGYINHYYSFLILKGAPL